MRLLQKATILIVLVVTMLMSGCAWQRIPPAPNYAAPSPLPFRVGVVLDNMPASANYGPGVVDLWKEMQLFKAITYPYREGDPVDGVLRLTINGGWTEPDASAGFLVGLTLGWASPFIGPSMTGVHDTSATLSRDVQEVARYTVRVESFVMWGVGANSTDVGNKASDLQRRKIAVELAQKIEGDRSILVKAFAK
jgi:hypothetical protein